MRSATLLRSAVADPETQATELEAAPAEAVEAAVEAPAADVVAVVAEAEPASENPDQRREGGRDSAGRGGRGVAKGTRRIQRTVTVQLEDITEGQEFEGTVVRCQIHEPHSACTSMPAGCKLAHASVQSVHTL